MDYVKELSIDKVRYIEYPWFYFVKVKSLDISVDCRPNS